MVVGGRLEYFSTLGSTPSTLLRSLRGASTFTEMQGGHCTLFFVVFTVLCVFVVLDMFIAIISAEPAAQSAQLARSLLASSRASSPAPSCRLLRLRLRCRLVIIAVARCVVGGSSSTVTTAQLII